MLRIFWFIVGFFCLLVAFSGPLLGATPALQIVSAIVAVLSYLFSKGL